ncbi:hypothetical protein C1I63_06485 [Rathayibacter caricis DSM 15933]|uniref:Htaa domain-containing protein n=1 Tax=Rathayibacter caricis DSM 15933 TaxID=1328867 RepID=A0A2T4USM1_9MICO|nr:hypothetical protein [Rathayibacter caricis]PTL72532.1 hypothetical protein C1I63_06485 [Rathayibacter caricis DSM 15933]
MRRLGSLLLAAALTLGLAPAAAAVEDGVDIDVSVPTGTSAGFGDIENAELRWGLNRESSGGAFAGGCNFLSAGVAGNSGGARVWSESDGLYAAEAGAVSIEKATAAGGWTRASFATRCTDPSGAPVTASSLASSTQSQVVVDGGRGSVSADGLTLRWSGAFTVAFYGGMTYWSASDPVLSLDAAGNGQLTATASGYGTSMEDTSLWRPLPATEIVLAEVRGAPLGDGGFSVVPEYLGVASQTGGQAPRTAENAAYWGSFPASFLQFQVQTGQAGYWLTTGGTRDAAKPATALLVNFDASAPAVVAAPESAAGGGAGPMNEVAQRPTGAGAVAGAGAGAGAAAAPAAQAAAGLVAETSTVVRDGGGLVPEAVASSGLLPLLIGALALAVLIAVLAVLHLSGRRVLPWRRPAPPE